MNRQKITQENIDNAVEEFRNMLMFRLKEKGTHSLASRHEALGLVATKYHELNDAVEHDDNIENVKGEFLDVAVGCVFAVACINQKTLDW